MWPDLVRMVHGFADGVLTGRDPTGHPFSVRCTVDLMPAERVLRTPRPPGVQLVDGPASLLWHSHDEALWTLRSFLLRGTLEVTAEHWTLTPQTLVPGNGMAGPIGDARTFLAARRRAGRYLARRGLPRPVVPWARVRELR